MVQGRRGIDEDDSSDRLLIREKDLCSAEGNNATVGPA